MTSPQASAGLRRDLEIVDLLTRPEHARDGLGVTRIAELLGREKSQVSRALRGLEAEGMVERDPESLAYRPGWRLYAMAARTAEARLTHVAAQYLRRLVASLNETAHLCVLRGSGVLTLLSVAPSHAFRALGWEGVTVPAPLTSAGRLIPRAPAASATSAMPGWSVLTTTSSISSARRHEPTARATRGTPPTLARFFSGTPTDPPRAGTTARTRNVNSSGRLCSQVCSAR